MLVSYRFRNFQSFRDWTEVDWSQNLKVPETDWLTQGTSGERLAKVMAVLGHNASGKTALLKALVFVHWFIGRSFAQAAPLDAIPVSPHFSAPEEPVEFEVVAELDGTLWRYELACTPKRVIREALYRKKERYGYVFIRETTEDGSSYKVKQQEFGFPAGKAEEACNLRQNASLIALAAQYGVPLATRLANAFVMSNINALGRMHMSHDLLFDAAEYFAKQTDQKKKMIKLLTGWDLGLSDVTLLEKTITRQDGSTIQRWIPHGVHRVASRDIELAMIEESSGTQAAFVLLMLLLPVLEAGGLAIIDEFENDLHPHMLEPILDLFANPATNPHNAQMLFTCHAVEVLNMLPKSQVMLVEKDTHCESSAWRLDSVEGIRSDDNYYAKYMAGAYGAVPDL